MGTALFTIMCVVCLVMLTKIMRLKEENRLLKGEPPRDYYVGRSRRWVPPGEEV